MSASTSEATRPGTSTLDERIARDCERSGVPFHVEDDVLLERVAELTELAWGIMFVVMPLGGVFYPVEALPGFVRPISELLPTTHAFAAGRDLVDGGPVP